MADFYPRNLVRRLARALKIQADDYGLEQDLLAEAHDYERGGWYWDRHDAEFPPGATTSTWP